MKDNPSVLPDGDSFLRVFMNPPKPTHPSHSTGDTLTTDDPAVLDAAIRMIGRPHKDGSAHQGKDYHPDCPGAD